MIQERIKEALLPVIGAVLILSLAGNGVLFFMLRGSWSRAAAYETGFEAQKSQVNAAKLANDALTATIRQLSAEKQDLMAKYLQDRAQAEREIANRDARIQAGAVRLEDERRRRNELTKEPTCNAFANTVVGDFCPDAAVGLRQRSRSGADSL